MMFSFNMRVEDLLDEWRGVNIGMHYVRMISIVGHSEFLYISRTKWYSISNVILSQNRTRFSGTIEM